MTILRSQIRKAADVANVPYSAFTDLPLHSTYDLFRNAAEEWPRQPALSYLPDVDAATNLQTRTFEELLQQIHQTANLLHRLGVGQEDTVAILLPIVPEAYLALWGAEAAGIAMPVNFLLNTDHIVEMLCAAKAKVLIAWGESGAIPIAEKVAVISQRVPSLRYIVQVAGESALANNTLQFNAEIGREGTEALDSGRNITRDQIAAYFHTGGTTGAPKLARHSHGNQLYGAWGSLQMYDYTAGEKIINGFPLFHVAGSIDYGLGALAAGMEVILPTASGMRNPDVVANHWKLAEQLQVTRLAGVPTSIAAVMSVELGDADISRVRSWLTGGSPLPIELAASFEAKFNIPIKEIFGMTETSGITAMTPQHVSRKPGSAGLPVPTTRMRVVKLDTLHSNPVDCAVNEQGAVIVSGPHIFQGYTDPALSAELFTADGWLISGDLGHLDDEGFIFLTGRAKDVIIRGGHNIDPLVIEEVVISHPEVEVAAAVGQPDAYAGELPVLYITPKPGVQPDVEAIREYVNNRVSEPPARPKAVFIIDSMPMTAIGKIFKPALRLDAAQRVFRQTLVDAGMETAVTCRHDPQLGMVAEVGGTTPDNPMSETIESRIRALLGPFNVHVAFTANWAE